MQIQIMPLDLEIEELVSIVASDLPAINILTE